jgi:uncharacterized protein YjbI with pentapeptide repeats
MDRAELVRSNLRGADLAGKDLSHINFSGKDLSEAILTGANLSGATLIGADLTDSHLDGANLSGVNVRNDDLSGTDFRGANLRLTHHLSSEQVQSAIIDRETLLPPNLQVTWTSETSFVCEETQRKKKTGDPAVGDESPGE